MIAVLLCPGCELVNMLQLIRIAVEQLWPWVSGAALHLSHLLISFITSSIFPIPSDLSTLQSRRN